MLTEMIEYHCKIEEKLTVMQSEMKRNVQGTNSEEETRNQISNLEQKEKINIQPEKNEETRIQKMRRGLGTPRTSLNAPTSEL